MKPTKVGAVPYEDVANVMPRLGEKRLELWFSVEIAVGQPKVFVTPIELGIHQDRPSERLPGVKDRLYFFKAKDPDGNVYRFEVFEGGAWHRDGILKPEPFSYVYKELSSS